MTVSNFLREERLRLAGGKLGEASKLLSRNTQVLYLNHTLYM